MRLWSPAIGAEGDVIAYGHLGRPVVVFPSEGGPAWQFEERGMVDAVGDLLDAGRVKLYCVSSNDEQTWSDTSVTLEERARRHEQFEDWIVHQVVPWIADDCGGRQDESIRHDHEDIGRPGSKDFAPFLGLERLRQTPMR